MSERGTKIETWNKQQATAWVDSDGDIGIIDTNDYSILLSPAGARQLRDWLTEQLEPKPAVITCPGCHVALYDDAAKQGICADCAERESAEYRAPAEAEIVVKDMPCSFEPHEVCGKTIWVICSGYFRLCKVAPAWSDASREWRFGWTIGDAFPTRSAAEQFARECQETKNAPRG